MIPEPPEVSFWEVSPAFRGVCRRGMSEAAGRWIEPQLAEMGERAAKEIAPLSMVADRFAPRLLTHDERGERIDAIEYHPTYREMQKVAYGSGMLTIKYTPHEHSAESTFASFALGYLFAMAEMGLYCPLCMTDGVARIVTRHGTAGQVERVVPRLSSSDVSRLWTGGMFLTERIGGSDVGANETIARRDSDGRSRLYGRKWFCSNVDADVVLATARPEGAPEGTRGIRTHLLLPKGNSTTIDRIKEKLGVRSMPTGEVTLDGAVADEIGGFGVIAEMMNLSRLYNSVAAVAVIGRAIHEARWYVERRKAFGKAVSEFPLVRETLLDLEAEHVAALLLTFDTVAALQRSDKGDAESGRLLRILTPVTKAVTGKLAVPCVSECMELVGGNGYIEDRVMPRLLRDAQVLPIWEGTTNILVLDMLRSMRKERSHELMIARIRNWSPAAADTLEKELASLEERNARRWMDLLARSYELALLAEAGESAALERLASRPIGLLPGAKI